MDNNSMSGGNVKEMKIQYGELADYSSHGLYSHHGIFFTKKGD
jgi:hypothetical protein